MREVRWSGLSEGGVTLLSVVTALETLEGEDLAEEATGLKAKIANALTGSPQGLSGFKNKDDEPTTATEYAGLLLAGLVAGGLLSFGIKAFTQ